jgi:hypothetical protein
MRTQLDQQQELPIRFISKALHKAQLNWSTFEKEAYAIFYTITKFDFLLRDVRFVVETDHKNLTFLKTASQPRCDVGSLHCKNLTSNTHISKVRIT